MAIDNKDTDHNGDKLVGEILDIIDKERSRYKVAIAIAAYIRRSHSNTQELTHTHSNDEQGEK